jgi:retron-type reverse transcriptase
VVTVLNKIYETDFRGFSYGFRPGRNPHQALDALNAGLQKKRVNQQSRRAEVVRPLADVFHGLR